jgi:hypothetical protein
MRQTLMLATMALMTACGATGNTPWDQNHDGLITACEGLNLQACDATAGCEHQPVVCTMICRDDGHGGCIPCAGGDLCRPVTPAPTPLPLDCSQLSTSVCANTPACEVVEHVYCTGADDPTVPHCGNGTGTGTCTTVSACAPRGPAQCEQLDSSVCLAHPGCGLEGFACAIACDADGSCPPCADPVLRCVTLHPPDDCGSRDPNVCSMDGRCVLEQGPVCDAVCSPDGSCPPCAIPSLVCVPAPPPDVCGSRDPSTCGLDGLCMVEPAPLCLCTPDGVCPPCAAPSQRCVPVPVPDVCAGRDLNSCEFDGRCTILAWACPAICEPDGNGGCLPCDAPPAVCVPVAVSQCDGLQDRASCQAAGCQVIDLGLACTQDCRDDGHGGCLPCKDFVCTDGSTSGGGSSGGTPPPSPRP